MATPLAELLDAILFDPTVREHFQQSSEHFLRNAGHEHLDAADIQEALFVLADGSPPLRAEQLIAGGHAIGDPVDLDGLDDLDSDGFDAADGLVAAIEAMVLDEPGVDDPQTLDDDTALDDDLDTGDDSWAAPVEDLPELDDTEFGAGTGDDVAGVEFRIDEQLGRAETSTDDDVFLVDDIDAADPTLAVDPSSIIDPTDNVLRDPVDEAHHRHDADQHTDPLDDPDDTEWSDFES